MREKAESKSIYLFIPTLVQGDDTISCHASLIRGTTRPKNRSRGDFCTLTHPVLFSILLLFLILVPASAQDPVNISARPQGPDVVHVGVFVEDFNKFSVEDGTVQAHFYANLHSDKPFSMKDFEIKNGEITQFTEISDTPTEKRYRFFATLTVEPDLRRFPFDTHKLPIIVEPKTRSEESLVMVVDDQKTGFAPEASPPGWQITDQTYTITNQSYLNEAAPVSRLIFNYEATRDHRSTALKFFLPIFIIVLISLGSLIMKTTSRLGVNASMFLAAVMIHWRIADSVPVVAYATFLDIFMVITYGTILMVIVSSYLIIRFQESKDTARVDLVNYWSLRIIPPFAIVMYLVLFLSLLLGKGG
jgi:hypothetical protein